MDAFSSEIISPEAWAQGKVGETVAVDFETFYTATYSVQQLGHWAYCHDPRFHAYLVAVSDGERTCACAPAKFPWPSLAGRTWVSHNRDFDRAVFERLRELGVIAMNSVAPKAWFCSAALCAYLQLPRDLEGAVKAVFGQSLDKGPRTQARGRRPDEDFLEAAEISRYAGRDAAATLALWNHLERHWPAHERRLSDLTSEMGSHGVCLDWQHVGASKRELDRLADSLAASLPWQPALSIRAFQETCERAGIAPPDSTSADDPGLQLWQQEHAGSQAAAWVREMQRIRSANRTARVLEAMEARRLPNGRMVYELKYFGATTGRWSGGGGLNLQNLNRRIAEGVDLRRAIVAPPGQRPGAERAFGWNPRDLELSLEQLRERFAPEVWETFSRWAADTEIAEGVTVYQWLSQPALLSRAPAELETWRKLGRPEVRAWPDAPLAEMDATAARRRLEAGVSVTDPTGQAVHFTAALLRHWELEAAKQPDDLQRRLQLLPSAWSAVQQPVELWDHGRVRVYLRRAGEDYIVAVFAPAGGEVRTYFATRNLNYINRLRRGTLLWKTS